MFSVFNFKVEFEGDIPSYVTLPIYDEEMKALLGGFVLESGEMINGFISGVNHPAGLSISIGDSFFITAKEGEDGKISHAVVSELSISHASIEVKKTTQEVYGD